MAVKDGEAQNGAPKMPNVTSETRENDDEMMRSTPKNSLMSLLKPQKTQILATFSFCFLPLLLLLLLGLQRRPAHAKPDFNWLSGPRNGTWKRTCGISCLRSLAPMRRLQCSTTQATFTNPSLLRLLRYSVVCLNSITQCNWHDIETMAE